MKHRGVTINDVAQAAGVSRTTAVFVLNGRPDFRVHEATRKRVQDAARQLGYRRDGVAAALSAGRIGTVGLVIRIGPRGDADAVSASYSKEVVVAVAQAAAAVGLRMTLILMPRDGTLSAADAMDRRVDGLVLASLDDEEFAREIFATGFPAVTLGSGYSERRVAIDNRGGARAATQHLLDLGHRRVAHVQGVPYVTDAAEHSAGVTTVDRAAGFREALEASGEAVEGRLLGYQEVLDQMERRDPDRPTGLFAYNDFIAAQLVVGAMERGLRVPRDVSVVGFDNVSIALTTYPQLTTVENPLDAQAEAAVAALQALWRGEEARLPLPIPTRLIVRKSTGPVPEVGDGLLPPSEGGTTT